MCIGDFNEITRVEEKSGGVVHPEKQMQDFRDCLDVCGLKDLGYSGLPFTWCNRKLLVTVEGDSMARRNHARVKFLYKEISRLMDCEERMWSQRSKTKWLRYGDQNTK